MPAADRPDARHRRRVIVLVLVALIQLLGVSERLLAGGQAPVGDRLSSWLSNIRCPAMSSGPIF
jgi:hypothetical protein